MRYMHPFWFLLAVAFILSVLFGLGVPYLAVHLPFPVDLTEALR